MFKKMNSIFQTEEIDLVSDSFYFDDFLGTKSGDISVSFKTFNSQ